MYEMAGLGLNGVNWELPIFLGKEKKQGNEVWGADYIVYLFDVPNERDIEDLIDNLVLMKGCQTHFYQ